MRKPKRTKGRPNTSKTATTSKRRSRTEFDYAEGWAYVNLRIPSKMLQNLDKHLSLQTPKVHRMHWIIRAIVEKMERDIKGVA